MKISIITYKYEKSNNLGTHITHSEINLIKFRDYINAGENLRQNLAANLLAYSLIAIYIYYTYAHIKLVFCKSKQKQHSMVL